MDCYIHSYIHWGKYTLNTWVLKITEQYVVTTISRHTGCIPTEDIISSRLRYSDVRCSQVCCLSTQMILGILWAHQGLLLAHPGVPLVVTIFSTSLQMFYQLYQVHLMATALVQSSMGFDHLGILVWQLPNTPGGSQWKNVLCWCLLWV